MEAVTIPGYGAPDVLEVRTYPDPEPGDGEVLVETRACGLNFADLMARQGLYDDAPEAPCVVGYEVSGIVQETGKDVTSVQPGDRVIAATKFGGQADRVCVPAENVVPMPDDMSFREGAAIPVNFITAYHMLFVVVSLRPGQRVLIHMAAGGVGTAAIQLCQTVENVEVFGTASSSKHGEIEELGVDYPIDYRNRDYEEVVLEITGGEGVDVVLDPLGGHDWKKGYRLLRDVGHLVAFGFANMFPGESRSWLTVLYQYFTVPSWHPLTLMEDNKSISGVNIGHLWNRFSLLRGECDELMDLYREDYISPVLDRSFPFSRAPEAHQRMHDRKNTGKLLLVPDSVYTDSG